MRDYYYIKVNAAFSSVYLNKDNELVETPENIKIFMNVEDAVEAKRDVRFQFAYSFDQVEIKRF